VPVETFCACWWSLTFLFCYVFSLVYFAEIVCNKAMPVQAALKAHAAFLLQQQQQLEAEYAADAEAADAEATY
jgi:hypothetical protein